MAFTFKEYGTFTGPGVNIEFRDNDDFSTEPFEAYTEFSLNDVAMALVSSPTSPVDFVYLHLDGSSTDTVTLERNRGSDEPIPTLNIEADFTNVSGEVCINSNLTVDGGILAEGVLCATISACQAITTPLKCFDIPHPLKENKRLVYSCLEGPEIGVYVRGRLTNSNVIDLPDYWGKLVDPESITVSLTQIGYSQDLIVEKIEWGRRVVIKSGNGANIDCYYTVNATRNDLPPLEVEQDP